MYIHILVVFILLMAIPSYSQDIPSSTLSCQVVEHQSKRLSKQLNAVNLELGCAIFIQIFKESKEFEIWMQDGNQFIHFKTYSICTYGGMGFGPKIKEGDGRAPEGFYFITPKQLNPYSNFHLSINLGYPNNYDRYHQRTGSALMIHGECVSLGCYAMTNPYIEEIYTLAYHAFIKGQPFIRTHIFPFRMNDSNIKAFKDSEWFEFWENLKEGYDIFNQDHIPPDVQVEGGKYIFRVANPVRNPK